MSDTAGNMENGLFFVELLDIFVGGSTCKLLESSEKRCFRFKTTFFGQCDQSIFFMFAFADRLLELLNAVAVDKIVISHFEIMGEYSGKEIGGATDSNRHF